MLTDEQIEYIEARGVPTGTHYYWLASISDESEMPTDREIEQVRCFIEYQLTCYREGYQPTIRELGLSPFRASDPKAERVRGGGNLLWCGNHNTISFCKGWAGHPGWFWRRASWSEGPRFCPAWLTGVQAWHRLPHTLAHPHLIPRPP